MDSGETHLQDLRDKKLPVDEINVYNHMAAPGTRRRNVRALLRYSGMVFNDNCRKN